MHFSFRHLSNQCRIFVFALSLSVPILCTDVCCRFRSQHSRPESPSYDLQARTPLSMITRKDSPLHSGQVSPNGSAENECILDLKRGKFPGELLRNKHYPGYESSLRGGTTPSKKRQHTLGAIKIEQGLDKLPPNTDNKTTHDLKDHSWKLSAVEVECRHCNERKLLPCSYLKLSPTLVQSARIPQLEGESACRARPEKHGHSDELRLTRTAACA